MLTHRTELFINIAYHNRHDLPLLAPSGTSLLVIAFLKADAREVQLPTQSGCSRIGRFPLTYTIFNTDLDYQPAIVRVPPWRLESMGYFLDAPSTRYVISREIRHYTTTRPHIAALLFLFIAGISFFREKSSAVPAATNKTTNSGGVRITQSVYLL